jgi:hypothetical protein
MAMLTRQTGKRAPEQSGPSATQAVNLLPAETVQRHRARVIARRFVLAGLGVLVAGAGVWLAQAAAIDSAQTELATAESELADAQSRLEPLQPVKAFSSTLDQQQELIGTSMAQHTSFSRALTGFAGAWPAGSSLRTLDATLGSGCPGPDVFQPAPSIGCLTWAVTVPGERQVRDLAADLETRRGLVSPYLTGVVRQDGTYEATGTVNFDERLLTRRFADLLEEVAP